jgi:hypothetical protein
MLPDLNPIAVIESEAARSIGLAPRTFRRLLDSAPAELQDALILILGARTRRIRMDVLRARVAELYPVKRLPQPAHIAQLQAQRKASRASAGVSA